MALNLRALFGVGTSANVTSVSVSNAAATELLSASSSRKGFVIHNESGSIYVKLGTDASATDYTRRLTSSEFWEVANYTGIVTARKTASGTTNVLVTSIH